MKHLGSLQRILSGGRTTMTIGKRWIALAVGAALAIGAAVGALGTYAFVNRASSLPIPDASDSEAAAQPAILPTPRRLPPREIRTPPDYEASIGMASTSSATILDDIVDLSPPDPCRPGPALQKLFRDIRRSDRSAIILEDYPKPLQFSSSTVLGWQRTSASLDGKWSGLDFKKLVLATSAGRRESVLMLWFREPASDLSAELVRKGFAVGEPIDPVTYEATASVGESYIVSMSASVSVLVCLNGTAW